MSPEEFAALNEVLQRRLHNTRDPELQALLWQLGELYDEMQAKYLVAEKHIQWFKHLADSYYRLEGRPDGNSAGGDREDRHETQNTDGSV